MEGRLDRRSALREALDRDWYHTIDLGPGETTRGAVDLRAVAPRVLPADLAGGRALDIGTFDGFWAFELERRGAEEVVAVDLGAHQEQDWPPTKREQNLKQVRARDSRPDERFWLAHAALESRVRHVECSIYDLSPERLGGGSSASS